MEKPYNPILPNGKYNMTICIHMYSCISNQKSPEKTRLNNSKIFKSRKNVTKT